VTNRRTSVTHIYKYKYIYKLKFVVCDKRRENGLYEMGRVLTHLARASQTFYRKNIYKISPPPGQINGELVEINAYPAGAMAVAV